jgi:Uma2 family endonuclease
MAINTQRVTADELLRLPDDGMRHELVRGELLTMAPAGEEHGLISVIMASSLFAACRRLGYGRVVGAETGFKLSANPDTVRAPDVAVILGDAARQPVARGFPTVAPTIVVEVVSPHDLYTEVDAKVADWLEAGSALVLVANPRRQTVAEHRSNARVRMYSADDTLEADDLLPGWRLPVREIFEVTN